MLAPMPDILPILKYPDPFLRRKAKRVERVTPEIRDMAARMLGRVPERARIRLQQSEEPVRDLELGEFKEAVRAHLGAGK